MAENPRGTDPVSPLSESEIDKGLNTIIREGLATQAMVTLSSGIFLVAYALQLGASNFTVGLLAAILPLSQLIQIPAIYLVEHYRRRRLISTTATSINRFFLVPIALIPLIFHGKAALGVLVAALSLHTSIGAISLCSWNSWMRDLIPQNRLGDFFGKRMSLATIVSVVLSLAAGFYIDYWEKTVPHKEVYAYSIMFGIAWLFGVIGTFLISRIPEPPMNPESSPRSFIRIIAEPLKDKNFRHLIHFLGSWNFAVNLAAPFFTVYMLKLLNLNMSYVIGLTVLSQIMNVLFLRVWGRFSDRFSNKTVLAVSGPIFMLSILAWTFTTFPETHNLTMPLLILIHIIMGISLAGVLLASGNIALKLAPKGEATAYMAAASLVNSLAAGIAPILGGRFADFFARRQFTWDMTWKGPDGEVVFQTLNFQSWDFFFFLAFVIGLYSIHRLAMVKEEGEVDESVLRQEFFAYMKRPLRNFSTAGGLRYLISQPINYFRNHRLNGHKNHDDDQNLRDD